MDKPILFNLEISSEKEKFLDFKTKNLDVSYVDTLEEQENELSLVRNPSLISHSQIASLGKISVGEDYGTWIYFPWKKTAVRILNVDKYFELRSSRNHNLIKIEEETILKDAKIAVAGLNVGNPGAVCLALESIGSSIKLADFDELSVTNLNRFRASLCDLGVNKAILSARQMYEINPFLNIEVYEKGITPENVELFLDSPKVDLLIEETDNLKLKINIRNMAKKYKIPVLMVTGNGSDVLVDVERYDLDENLPILSGYLSDDLINKIQSIEKGKGSFEERVILARDFMGAEYLDPRLVSSFSDVGKTLAGIPQLAESSFLRGATICHFAKRILLKEKILSGRYKILLDGIKI